MAAFRKKKRENLQKRQKKAGSRAAEAACIPEKHPDAAGPCPSTAASPNRGKMGFKPKGAGLAVASPAWSVLLEQRASPGKGHWGGSALPVDQPGCREWSQHAGNSPLTPDTAAALGWSTWRQGGREENRPKQPLRVPLRGGEGKGTIHGHLQVVLPCPCSSHGTRGGCSAR